MASEPFDAVLAELRSIDMMVTNTIATRLAAAHAAEVAERDELRERNGQLAATMLNERARAEAAERDARRLQEVLNRVPTGELNEWLGCEMERYERAPTLDEFRAAIDAAIATTEQADAS